MIKIINHPTEWKNINLKNKTIGFVPTMGALHEGHARLIRAAREQNDLVVVSIFVNPTQFNNKEDLEKYPSTLKEDIHLLQKLDVDYLFYPDYQAMYPDQFTFKVCETHLSSSLCGTDRPGHFDGVLTVVLKLLNIIKPQKVYFGEKDFQQMRLIQGLIHAFFLDIELIPVATVREDDGLAMSSRNVKLSSMARQKAPLLYQNLVSKKTLNEIKKDLEKEGFLVNYIEEKWGRRFIAATIEHVRLIDNVER